MQWHKFDRAKTRGRWLPVRARAVLVQCTPKEEGHAPAVAVGYLKFAAGDRQCPYFVVPGVPYSEVVAWCDCLGNDFSAPEWSWPGQPTK